MEKAMVKFNPKNTSIISVIGMDVTDRSPADNHPNTAEKEDHPKRASFAFGLRPIYLISRVFGLLPFSIIHDSNGVAQEPRFGKLDALWMVINIGIYVSMAYLTFYDIKFDQNSTGITTTLLTGDDLLILMKLILGMIMIGLDLYNRFGFIEIWRKFSIFDAEASLFSPKPPFNRFYIVLIIFSLQISFPKCRWQTEVFISIMGKAIDVIGFIAPWYRLCS